MDHCINVCGIIRTYNCKPAVADDGASVSDSHLCLLHPNPPPTAGPYYNPRPRQRIPRDLAMCVTPSGQFYCSMCNCGAEQETDFRQHLESKQHKAKVSELRYRHEMENLGYS